MQCAIHCRHNFYGWTKILDLFKFLCFQGGEDWKRKLVQPPNHYEGSFVDADMQKFRPEPNPSPAEDPWFASRLPDQTMMSYDRLTQGPASTYSYPELPLQGPYGTMYPQDQLSQIKMRNRRFMNACAMEMGQGMGMQPYGQPMMPMGMMGPQQPMMMGPMGPQPMMMGPPPMMDAEMATDELSVSVITCYFILFHVVILLYLSSSTTK